MVGQDRHAVSADLVGGVAVGGDAVRPQDDQVHLPLVHQGGRGPVGDEGVGNPQLAQLPGGEPGPLEEGPGFVHPHGKALAGLPGGPHDPQGGAVGPGGQGPGVAVGQHPVAVVDQDLPRLGHVAVNGFIFPQHGLGFGHQPVFQGRHRFAGVGLGQALHPFQGPEEVHRGGPGLGDFLTYFLKASLELPGVGGIQVQSPQRRPHGGGHPDGRGPPDGQGADGFDDLVIILDFQIELFGGQTPLIQKLDLIHIPTNAAIGDHLDSGFQFSVFSKDKYNS